jgi:ATP-dependent Clp protease ATP-binding subunit ClpX
VRQYQKLLALDNVELDFTPEALHAASREALRRKMGARGLRTIIEEVLLDVMYEVPSQPQVRRWTVTAEAIQTRRSGVSPLLDVA